MILYLHGFRSSPSSFKARALAEHLTQKGLGDRMVCPALSHVPAEAMAQAEDLLAQFSAIGTVIGSSLGGFYATALAERHGLNAALINPAVVAPLDLAPYLGTQSNLYTGESFEFTSQHIDQLRALEYPSIHPERYLLLVEKGDEVLDWRLAVDRYAGARQIVLPGGDHSFTRFAEFIPTLLAFAGLEGAQPSL